MSNRTAIVASVVLTGCVSISIVMPGVAFAAPDAASECLSAPKAATPAGGHWYYRLEKGTKRKCWYLGDAGGKVNKTAETAPAAVAEQDASPPKKPLQKSVANARAELRAGPPANEDTSLSESTWPPLSPAAEASHNNTQNAATQPAPEQTNPQDGNLSSRWPEPKSVASADEQPAAGAPAPAQTAPVLTPDRLVMAAATPAPAATSVPAVPPASATAPAEDNFSIRILLSILVGVLALAAIVGPVIFRFIKPRRAKQEPVQRRPIWDMNTSGAILRQDDPRMSPPPLAYVDPLPEPRVLDEAVDEIEDLLSRASRRSAA